MYLDSILNSGISMKIIYTVYDFLPMRYIFIDKACQGSCGHLYRDFFSQIANPVPKGKAVNITAHIQIMVYIAGQHVTAWKKSVIILLVVKQVGQMNVP